MPKKSGKTGLRVAFDEESKKVTISVWDFEAEKALTAVVFPYGAVAETLQTRVALYGLAKVLMDRTSQVKENPVEKLAGMKDVFSRLCEGEWKAERTGGGLGVVSPEIEALARVKKHTIPEIQAALKLRTPEERERILGHADVQKVADAIRKERAGVKEGVALDDLLKLQG